MGNTALTVRTLIKEVVSYNDWDAYGPVYSLDNARMHLEDARRAARWAREAMERGDHDDARDWQRSAAWSGLKARYALGLRDHAGDYDFA